MKLPIVYDVQPNDSLLYINDQNYIEHDNVCNRIVVSVWVQKVQEMGFFVPDFF